MHLKYRNLGLKIAGLQLVKPEMNGYNILEDTFPLLKYMPSC